MFLASDPMKQIIYIYCLQCGILFEPFSFIYFLPVIKAHHFTSGQLNQECNVVEPQNYESGQQIKSTYLPKGFFAFWTRNFIDQMTLREGQGAKYTSSCYSFAIFNSGNNKVEILGIRETPSGLINQKGDNLLQFLNCPYSSVPIFPHRCYQTLASEFFAGLQPSPFNISDDVRRNRNNNESYAKRFIIITSDQGAKKG